MEPRNNFSVIATSTIPYSTLVSEEQNHPAPGAGGENDTFRPDIAMHARSLLYTTQHRKPPFHSYSPPFFFFPPLFFFFFLPPALPSPAPFSSPSSSASPSMS